jgi:hypothetical protein
MCSTAAERIAEIGQAIDDLAGKTGPTVPGDTDPLVVRVAELWTLLVELDPEVAKRLAGYQALATPKDLDNDSDGPLPLRIRWRRPVVAVPV